ncbi:MAG TPA: DUF1579 domain-containing protein [Chthoniobacterales bacterium]|nr:DUF1579 domain-containing protein [Chthoniobacterales bacterium]
MNILTTTLKSLTLLFVAAGLAFAQTPSAKTAPDSTKSASSPAAAAAMTPATAAATTTTASTAPSAEEMKKMMELSQLNDNHKLLASTAGTWSYVVKMWMDPKGSPTESKGTAIRKAVMDGRYVTGDYSGNFKMPGADGKPKEMKFQGMSMDGYDNVKQKFVSGWVDNMGTGIYITEGTYDASSKTITYTGEFEMMPGMKSKVRELIKFTDKDHMAMEYFEDRGQGEAKSMEISYTRKK